MSIKTPETPHADRLEHPSSPESRFSLRQKVGAAVVTVVVAGGAALGFNEMNKGGSADNDTAPEPGQPVAAAPEAPGAVEEVTDIEPIEAAEPTPSTVSLEDVWSRPTPEQVTEAAKGISADLSVEEAVIRYGQILNVYMNSAEVDIDNVVSQASQDEGRNILEALYGQYLNEDNAGRQAERRAIISGAIAGNEYIGVPFSQGLTMTPDTSTIREYTNGETTIEAFQDNQSSNQDATETSEFLNADFTNTLMMVQEDGRWYVKSVGVM